jgi:hypothetical protein
VSVEAMYGTCGPIDAVICTAGNVHFGPLAAFTQDTFMIGLRDKVVG